MIPINDEGLYGATQRLPDQRTNTYPAPNALDIFATGLKAFDCRNVNNPQSTPALGSAPPCVEQGPFRFRKVSRRFPHVGIAPK